jgi:hypothetical protein
MIIALAVEPLLWGEYVSDMRYGRAYGVGEVGGKVVDAI